MAQFRVDLNEDELSATTGRMVRAWREIEECEIGSYGYGMEDLSVVFGELISIANDTLEWVAQAKASLARQGLAA